MQKHSDILIVDDDEKNVKLLTAILQAEGYRCEAAFSGPEALNMVRSSPPDLVLLDIMMPEMDGYEVLKRLKTSPQTSNIPVVMVTALTERDDKVKALELGADDFISKPIDKVELSARIRSLLRIKRYQDELEEKLQEIEKQNEHIKQLMRERKALVDMIIHDLKSPIAGLQGYLEIILLNRKSLDEKTVEFIEKALHCSAELELMITNILALEKSEETPLKVQRQPVSPQELLQEALAIYDIKIKRKNLTIQKNDNFSQTIQADPSLLKRVIYNLLDNAIKNTKEGGEIIIELQLDTDKEEFIFSIQNKGTIIPMEQKEKIFQMFEQANTISFIGSYGIGLAFCKMAIEAHGGKIWVETSEEDSMCTFRFSIPQG